MSIIQIGTLLLTGFSVLLTAILILLYKQQKDLLAVNHKGIIDVTDFEFERPKGTYRNWVVKISNHGDGVVTNLKASILVRDENSADLELQSEETSLVRIESDNSRGGRPIVREISEFRDALKPRETTTFAVEPPSSIFEELAESGHDRIFYCLVITGEDMAGNELIEPVQEPCYAISLDEMVLYNYQSIDEFSDQCQMNHFSGCLIDNENKDIIDETRKLLS